MRLHRGDAWAPPGPAGPLPLVCRRCRGTGVQGTQGSEWAVPLDCPVKNGLAVVDWLIRRPSLPNDGHTPSYASSGPRRFDPSAQHDTPYTTHPVQWPVPSPRATLPRPRILPLVPLSSSCFLTISNFSRPPSLLLISRPRQTRNRVDLCLVAIPYPSRSLNYPHSLIKVAFILNASHPHRHPNTPITNTSIA